MKIYICNYNEILITNYINILIKSINSPSYAINFFFKRIG